MADNGSTGSMSLCPSVHSRPAESCIHITEGGPRWPKWLVRSSGILQRIGFRKTCQETHGPFTTVEIVGVPLHCSIIQLYPVHPIPGTLDPSMVLQAGARFSARHQDTFPNAQSPVTLAVATGLGLSIVRVPQNPVILQHRLK